MDLDWIHENPATWDANKRRIIDGVPTGVFAAAERTDGDLLPGDWWRVERDGTIVGYGWMDCTWGDAEILLAVDPQLQKQGAGSFILDRLEREAAARGLNYLYNVVRSTHPDRSGITRWLESRGFARSHDDETLRRSTRIASSE